MSKIFTRHDLARGFGMTLARPLDHDRIREQLRQKYHIWEGCKARILHRDLTGKRYNDTEAYTVTITAINKHHVTVQFPKGFRESMSWDDFEKELMVLL